MLNLGQVIYFGIHRSPLLLPTSNYWKEKGHLEETKQAWSWLRCLEKSKQISQMVVKTGDLYHYISTMVQSVKKHLKRIQAKVLIVETKAAPKICWSEICIKHTQQLQACSFRKKSCQDFRKLISWKMILLCKCGKKIPSLSTINDIAAFNFWKSAVHQLSSVMHMVVMHPTGLTST